MSPRDAASVLSGPSRPLAAAGWMVGAIISFGAMAIAGRELSAELDTFEIMAYRSAIGLPIITAMLLATYGPAGMRTRQPGAHLTRNVIHFAAQNFWFFGIATIPLAQLVAIEFTNPIWVALFAPLLLGERMTRAGMIAAALGFAGVLIVTRPGLAPLGPGHAAALAAAIGFALTNIWTKRLSRMDGTLNILFWMTLSQMLMGIACALPGGITVPSTALAPWVLFVGICGLTAHFSLTRALFAAPATVVAPMEFMRLPAIAIAAALIYGEPLEIAVFVGAALILAGNLVNLRGARR
ncbi:DMT family transporter [Limibaculum sp. M0105]|uniref:DMT family transporter n=1 Tax=Thermohalobaculum xanthum TaxID=2753746 RepID=A0A8J7M3Y4_9RHOB|nr:DMT family transporter [Thermohalobaculum xanthum]MBK0397724.1 DMT family transporter [Thermohalobaculum xanthum]